MRRDTHERLYLEHENGKMKSYEVILKINNAPGGKDLFLYTDGKRNKFLRKKVYAVCREADNPAATFLPVTEEIHINLLSQAIAFRGGKLHLDNLNK